MLVLIVHLARAAHRKVNVENLKSQLSTLIRDSDIRVLPAVDGAKVDPEIRKSFVEGASLRPPYPFALSAGELGCFLSHRDAWSALLNSDHEQCLVLEDDAVLDAGAFSQALKLFSTSGPYCQLQTRLPKGFDLSPDASLIDPVPLPLRTTAQVFDRTAAARLLSQSESIDRPIDTFLQMPWHHGVAIKVMYPSGVSEADGQVGATTIQVKKGKGFFNKMRREYRRWVYRRQVRLYTSSYRTMSSSPK